MEVRRAAKLTASGGGLELELLSDEHVDASEARKARHRFLPEAVHDQLIERLSQTAS